MRAYLGIFAFAGLLSFGSISPTAAQPVTNETSANSVKDVSVELFPEFNKLFDSRLQDAGIPGGVFAVVQRDRILHIHSFGVRGRNTPQPVDADTVFRIASVSKTFASGLAAKLQADQLFAWHDPITEFIPGFTFKDQSVAPQVQIEHLLAHSAGVIPNAYDNLIEANLHRDQILPHFRQLNPMCVPGQCYGYQNVLFSLIEPVLESRTGSSYEELLHQHLFSPLNMASASVGHEAFLATENRALPHVRGRGVWFQREATPHYYRFPAAAGVNASARDLGEWVIAQLGYRPDVLPMHVLEDIREPRIRTVRDLRRNTWRRYLTDAHYSLGWRIYQFQDSPLVYHGGWVQGFRADVGYSPDHEIGLVILINAESNVINELTTTFWAEVLPRMREEQWIPYYHATRARASDAEPTDNVKSKQLSSFPFQSGFQTGNSLIETGLLNR
ncbi:MAG: beta-lactamase family protein [Idiomarina sp.]|nr:beta-lactamase family protein [Idiomarina sp.]